MIDLIDKLLAAGSVFDWITPIANEMKGYNRGVYRTRNYRDAVAYQMELKKHGIKARVDGNPIIGYIVVTK